jgi:hypothetical protein
MATVTFQIHNAAHKPLDDTIDLSVVDPQTSVAVHVSRDVSGRKAVRVTKLLPGRTYMVRVFPKRYRAVARFFNTIQTEGEATPDCVLSCPVIPERVIKPDFPLYADLDDELKSVLEASTLESAKVVGVGASAGERLFNSLSDLETAGLLNLYCKMSHTHFGGQAAWAFVTDVYRVRGDRIFANVELNFRDRVKTGLVAGIVKEADDSLHKPGPGFANAGSFKTREPYGNLQISFFSSTATPLHFRVDADIDNAAGFEHAFQVIGNAITNGETHPYDIHQILTYQRLPVGYGLPV